jgi:hypothetical protein
LVLVIDPVDDGGWKDDRASGRTSRGAWARLLDVLRDEALELVDRNQTLTPRRLHGAHGRDKSPVDGRDAHTERLSRLAAAVGETPNMLSLSEIEMRKRRWPSADLALIPPPLPPPLSSRAQGVVQ